jgi:AcrR family transcriptional regulator
VAQQHGPALSSAAWVEAALDAIAEGGLAAVAIEPLARRLGTTKGSFYNYFPNRDALITAALARWEQAAAEEPIKHLDLIRDPRDRLRVLATATLTHRLGGMRDAALSASADHPLVKPVLERVTAQRMAFITAIYTELGWPPDQAQRRALLVYSAYVGLFHYLRASPSPGLTDDQLKAYADELISELLHDPN